MSEDRLVVSGTGEMRSIMRLLTIVSQAMVEVGIDLPEEQHAVLWDELVRQHKEHGLRVYQRE